MTKVAFVSFRLKAEDTVSTEAEKWIRVFREWGWDTYRLAGYIPGAGENDYLIPELNDRDPLVESFTTRAFKAGSDRHKLRRELASLVESLERGFLPAIAEIAPDLVVAENIFSLPVNIPLAMVVCRYLAEEGTACIAVHHDFYWEHDRFRRCRLEELMASHFPPPLPQAAHVTVSSQARDQLYRRTGITATCIRNCFDFDDPREAGEENRDLRRELGISDRETFFLQPTQAMSGKGMGLAAGFVQQFSSTHDRGAKLVVSSCEENYRQRLGQLRRGNGGIILDAATILGPRWNSGGSAPSYDIYDAYTRCDMVIFASPWEGFGNPVMESVVHRKPLLAAGYPVLNELRTFGFQFLPLDELAVYRAAKLLKHPSLAREMTDRNFAIGKKHFSLDILREELSQLVSTAVLR